MPLVNINGTWVMVCTRSGIYPKPCFYCGAAHTRLCDYPISKYKSGKKKGEWKTCDLRMCDDHTQQGVSGETDFCRKHFPLAKAAYERRLERAKDVRKD